MMRDYYARDPKTGCKGRFTPLPGKPLAPDNRLFIITLSVLVLRTLAGKEYTDDTDRTDFTEILSRTV
jgi:hypothetical protein